MAVVGPLGSLSAVHLTRVSRYDAAASGLGPSTAPGVEYDREEQLPDAVEDAVGDSTVGLDAAADARSSVPVVDGASAMSGRLFCVGVVCMRAWRR